MILINRLTLSWWRNGLLLGKRLAAVEEDFLQLLRKAGLIMPK